MIKLLYENNQIIHVSADRELQKSTITYALVNAQSLNRYAKFYTSKYYIQVIFNRDSTICITSNYRSSPVFNKAINDLDSSRFMIGEATYFIWFWMNKLRKM